MKVIYSCLLKVAQLALFNFGQGPGNPQDANLSVSLGNGFST